MSGFPLLPVQALDAWNVLAEDPRCQAQPVEELPDENIFRACVADRASSPNLWTDAWLAALALTLDEEFVTFDRGFQSFDGLRLSLLTVS
jgi:predicted nucleic acid-binding protein